MLKVLFLVGILLVTIPVCSQETVTVISIKANLRGTPSTSGLVVTTVNKGEKFELIKDDAPWYLVQTPTYVGWIHGNSIEKNDADDFEELLRSVRTEKLPKVTSKPVSTGESPFQSEYVGIDHTTIRITNSANRPLNLTFGGVKYTIPKNGERAIEAEGGNYEFYASAPGVLPKSGVKNFAKGYKYTWNFFIVTRYR